MLDKKIDIETYIFSEKCVVLEDALIALIKEKKPTDAELSAVLINMLALICSVQLNSLETKEEMVKRISLALDDLLDS